MSDNAIQSFEVRPRRSFANRQNDPSRYGSIRFGDFEVVPGSRALMFRGLPVDLGGRAFDLLMVLLASRGKIVSRETIMQQVWPTTTVDESNVRLQISCLRRALRGERNRIKTIPGRGYLFALDPYPARDVPMRRVAPAKAASPVVIIDGDVASRELLFLMLTAAGARAESFATVAAFLEREQLASGSLRSLRIAGIAA